MKIQFDWGRVRISLSHIPVFLEDFEMIEQYDDGKSNQILVYYQFDAPLSSYKPHPNLPFLSTFVTFSEELESYQTFVIDPDYTLSRVVGLSG